MLKQIKFVSVPVRDQERALRFWTDKIGLAVATDQEMGPGMRWIELRIPGAETRLVLFTPPGQEERIGSFQGISFQTDDIDATYAAMTEKGVETNGPPKKESWGSSVIFKDSEGNSFVLSTK